MCNSFVYRNLKAIEIQIPYDTVSVLIGKESPKHTQFYQNNIN